MAEIVGTITNLSDFSMQIPIRSILRLWHLPRIRP